MRPCLAFVVALLFISQLGRPASAAVALDNLTRREVISRLSVELANRYVFPERAAAAIRSLENAEKSGQFNASQDPAAFATAVTAQLARSLHDKHLHLAYSPEVLPPDDSDGEPTPQQLAEMRKHMAFSNFGLAKAMRLRGNIGYLDVRGFPPAEMMGPTLGAAMQFLSNTDALIIDARWNHGGDPDGVALLCSYLFPAASKVHINDIYTRTPKSTSGKIQQYWTSPISGSSYALKPVYVLTSSETFSGGEELAYDIQTQKRGILVGEVTGGGANPGDDIRLTDHFEAFIPTGRAINPITHTNWEGTGVTPDVQTSRDAALPYAYLALLRMQQQTVQDPALKDSIKQLITESTQNPASILLH